MRLQLRSFVVMGARPHMDVNALRDYVQFTDMVFAFAYQNSIQTRNFLCKRPICSHRVMTDKGNREFKLTQNQASVIVILSEFVECTDLLIGGSFRVTLVVD